jgi:predicted nucleotidyltransferase
MKLIQKHIKELKKLCEKHCVAELYVFGSVLTENFTPHSDLDFLVKFSQVNPADYFDNYMDFKENLEKLYSRMVDLVEIQTLKNPILKRSIDRNKVILYGREDSKVAV